MTSKDEKKNITRQNLQLHGIHYDAEVYNGNDGPTSSIRAFTLPDHVDAVREILLTFSGIIPPEEWVAHLQEEFVQYGSQDIGPSSNLQPPDSAIVRLKTYETRDTSMVYKDAFAKLKMHEEAAEEARTLLTNLEPGWQTFWREQVFKTASKDARMQPGFSPALDTWSLYEDVRWTTFKQLQTPENPLPARTQPQPDLTYAFPMLSPLSHSHKGFDKDDFSQCFSPQALGALDKMGIYCTPTTALRNWLISPKKELSPSDSSCFPWAVVEVKKRATDQKDIIERCYCQAANAAAAALELQAQLFENDSSNSLSNLPPVIVFTCIGPNVKVWLAYQIGTGIRQQRMVCIWSTSVQLTWGVAALRTIVMNMHVWASRLLKPKIQAWIFQALRRPLPNTTEGMKARITQQIPGTSSNSRQISTPGSSKNLFSPATWNTVLDVNHSRALHASSSSRQVSTQSPSKLPSWIPVVNAIHLPSWPQGDRSPVNSQTHPVATNTGGPSIGQAAVQDKDFAETAESDDHTSIDLTTKSFESIDLKDSGNEHSDSSAVHEDTEQNDPSDSDLNYPDSNSGSSDNDSDYTDSDGIDVEGAGNSGFNSANDSKDDSDSSSVLADDTNTTERHVYFSSENLKTWREASLQALSGKHIADMPIIRRLFYRLTKKQQLQLNQRALGSGKMPGDCYENKSNNELSRLLAYLNVYLEPDMRVTVEMFLHQKAQHSINKALAKMDTVWGRNVTLWNCLKDVFACRSGYTCVEILGPDLSILTLAERQELDHEAFEKLNSEDQNSTLLR